MKRSLHISVVITVLFLTGVTACKKKKNIPDGVIKPELYELLITDILLAEANHRVAMRNDIHSESMLDSSYQYIYAYHNVTADEVDSSFSFYNNNPHILAEITERVLDNLHKLEETPVKEDNK